MKAATIGNDIPIKLFHEFLVELPFPLSHILSFCIKNGIYPDIWKVKIVTLVPKNLPHWKIRKCEKNFWAAHLLKNGS